jgi:hypothetical protein
MSIDHMKANTHNKASALSLSTCVAPEGRFVYGLHRPRFTAANLRAEDHRLPLGETETGRLLTNDANFPDEDVHETGADPVFEIRNPFPFRGVTYIGKPWADRAAADPGRISIPQRGPVSLNGHLRTVWGDAQATPEQARRFFSDLPRPLKLALAVVSTDPADLVGLADDCADFTRDPDSGRPTGMVFAPTAKGLKPRIADQELFDAVANNPNLPYVYKEAMVLRPGIQGQNEIVGDRRTQDGRVFEYLRRNSYIPWGHYAANMGHDSVRYAVGDLSPSDVRGLRHLYYQRTYVQLAEALHPDRAPRRRELSVSELESLRRAIEQALKHPEAFPPLPFTATLWGWNYGCDYAPSGYRLHASHQQVHQQYALIPPTVARMDECQGTALPSFACGDMVHRFIDAYRGETDRPFFDCYQQAIQNNRRMDGRTDLPGDLVIHQDEATMLFVPKAQTSQWELQLMTRGPVGNILEADSNTRHSLDQALFMAVRILNALGATMITVFEYSKRFDNPDRDQRLLYTFLPRLPESPGAFSEAQLRWINGHYPEDFALACRQKMLPMND